MVVSWFKPFPLCIAWQWEYLLYTAGKLWTDSRQSHHTRTQWISDAEVGKIWTDICPLTPIKAVFENRLNNYRMMKIFVCRSVDSAGRGSFWQYPLMIPTLECCQRHEICMAYYISVSIRHCEKYFFAAHVWITKDFNQASHVIWHFYPLRHDLSDPSDGYCSVI